MAFSEECFNVPNIKSIEENTKQTPSQLCDGIEFVTHESLAVCALKASFQIVMDANNVSRYLWQLKYDMKIPVISFGDQNINIVNSTVACYLYS